MKIGTQKTILGERHGGVTILVNYCIGKLDRMRKKRTKKPCEAVLQHAAGRFRKAITTRTAADNKILNTAADSERLKVGS